MQRDLSRSYVGLPSALAFETTNVLMTRFIPDMIVQTTADAQSLRASLLTLNNALSRLTLNIPRLVAPELLAPPYPYGAANAHLAFFRVAEVTCVAYLTIIQMHGAGEMLRSFDEDFRVDLTSESGSRDKRLAAARAVVDVAIQVVAELDRPDSVSPKEALRVSLPVSIPFIFPCEASHFLNLTKLI